MCPISGLQRKKAKTKEEETKRATALAAEVGQWRSRTLADAVEDQISQAEQLDLMRRPRKKRNGDEVITVHPKRRQAGQHERTLIVTLARIWGWDNPALGYRQRRRIEMAACRQVAYDHGFPVVTGSNRIAVWAANLSSGITAGETAPLQSKHKGRKKKTDLIEAKYPGYLHELYRYATTTVGVKASFEELTDVMNEKSASPFEARPAVNLHRQQVYRWFKLNGGSETSAFEKPRLTDKHKKDRVAWVQKWGPIFLDENASVAYLDEK